MCHFPQRVQILWGFRFQWNTYVISCLLSALWKWHIRNYWIKFHLQCCGVCSWVYIFQRTMVGGRVWEMNGIKWQQKWCTVFAMTEWKLVAVKTSSLYQYQSVHRIGSSVVTTILPPLLTGGHCDYSIPSLVIINYPLCSMEHKVKNYV